MKKLKCYYAHTMISYNSTIEKHDLLLLKSLGFDVINPNNWEIAQEMKAFVATYGKEKTMDFFREIVQGCNVFAFRSLPDGKIPSGVAAELDEAIKHEIPVIELPCLVKNRMLTYPETKDYFTNLGFYKNLS